MEKEKFNLKKTKAELAALVTKRDALKSEMERLREEMHKTVGQCWQLERCIESHQPLTQKMKDCLLRLRKGCSISEYLSISYKNYYYLNDSHSREPISYSTFKGLRSRHLIQATGREGLSDVYYISDLGKEIEI